MTVDYKVLIRDLTENQSEVFDEICVGNQADHSLIILSSLIKKGLIERCIQPVSGCNFVIDRYIFASDLVYIAWCELCLEGIKGVNSL